ncbi:hypothetical protein DICVIV_04783 [Dictyocaulus viviparus]|uniref:Uncharacterized protein n=1 Tax=Dictyocaulus viviparus TaxID=29172 RepID=A0A0D8Y3B8_DICVI|nr:hypothetical protein DICVIV_04783 [Dictyocaulus viviparus]
MKLKCAEEELRDQLANKSVEITELRDNLSKANYEYSKLKEEFLEFQESAEHQYCATVKQKCDIIETIAARLEQLESYPGQVISTDSIHGNTVEKERGIVAEGSRTLYDCVSPSLLDAVERAGNISKDVADTVKLMQNTFIPIEIANMHNFSNLDQYEQQPQLSSLPVSWKQGFSYPLLKEESLLKQLINFLDNSKYIYRFLEGCDKQFYECAMLIVDKEKKAICDEKQSVERKFSSEKIKWEVDRENLEQQLCRYRRQAEKIDTMRNEKTSIASELNAAKVQIDQYRLKLRQKSNELEQIIAERDIAVQLADEFKKLDQVSKRDLLLKKYLTGSYVLNS